MNFYTQLSTNDIWMNISKCGPFAGTAFGIIKTLVKKMNN